MRTYVIIDASEIGNVNFDQVQETSADTLRYSLDGTKTFVKYEGNTPAFLATKVQHTHSEILGILSTEEWVDNNII